MLKYFSRNLRIRRKNEKYAERIFHHQQCLGTSKGKCFEKIEWGVICLPRMNSLAKKWLSIKQKLLYAYTETALNGKISTERVYNSVNKNNNTN